MVTGHWRILQCVPESLPGQLTLCGDMARNIGYPVLYAHLFLPYDKVDYLWGYKQNEGVDDVQNGGHKVVPAKASHWQPHQKGAYLISI